MTIGGFTLTQWAIILGKSPPIIAKVRTALPILMPIVDDVRALVHELGLDKPSPDKPLTPKEFTDKLGELTPEEKALFDRMSGNVG